MQRSSERILTTHAGSLPRPAALREIQAARKPGDEAQYESLVTESVEEVVRRQTEMGVAVVNDGEMSKIGGFAGYVRARLNGYEGGDTEPRPLPGAAKQFPDWGDFSNWRRAVGHGAISWKDFDLVTRDIANFKRALSRTKAVEGFLPATSPGTILNHNTNTYYKSRADYLQAIADTMKREYDAIAGAGFLLQIDCPDLAASYDTFYSDLSVEQFRRIAAENIEVLNHATRDIEPERMRIHTCWGAGAGPHTGDIAMREIVDLLLKARPAGLSFVAANGRHAHEWRVWEELKLPDDKVIIPGVIDSTHTIVEHPETVAERIERFARLVGRENVIAGVDCGFGYGLPPSIAWAKLKALGDGADIATRRLWPASRSTAARS
jgi:5-methyltetrahydropteroyltriglutamate--homocysteine methyltransferase